MKELSLCFLLVALSANSGWALDRSVNQLVVSIAPTWNSSEGRLQLFERHGGQWQAASAPLHVLYGKSGLAWGRGEWSPNESGLHKVEHDERAPAGVFVIGKIYTYDQSLPTGADYPFYTITAADAWIGDPATPLYNQHVVVDLAHLPPWYEKEKMRLNDPPHRWLIEIRHNADPPVAGAGSAIFFHIERGPHRFTAGCTTMTEESLLTLIRWLRQNQNPHYVLLPQAEYLQKWKAWGLPPPDKVADLLNR